MRVGIFARLCNLGAMDMHLSHYAGVAVHTPAWPMIARVILLFCSVDLPARAIVLNMKQWNGQHGCLNCESPGTTVDGDHLHRYWPKDDSAVVLLSCIMQRKLLGQELL